MRFGARLRVLSLLAPAVVLPACRPHAGPVAPPADRRDGSPGWELAWADEFDVDGRPDPNNWAYEAGFVRNQELQWYQPENAACENGLLVLTARRQRVADLRHAPDAPEWAKTAENGPQR